MLKIITIPVTEFGQNARVLICSETKDAVIVDPGGDGDRIHKVCVDHGVSVKAVWLTHSHLDHCGGVAPLLKKFPVPLYAHPDERMFRERLPDIAMMYGLSASEWPACPEPSMRVGGGEEVSVGNNLAKVIHTPGHSPGHVSFYFQAESVIISGDVLFQGSIGRTDLPGGDHKQLLQTIRSEFLPLPDSTRVLSGHGDDTTIGAERKSNPFLS